MPRRIRSADLETRSARLRLDVRKKPYSVQVAPGVHLLYRRNKRVGSWVVKAALGRGRYWTDAFAHADDVEVANGGTILDYWQAIERARSLARSNEGEENDKPVTVKQALEAYAADLRARNGDIANAGRVRAHLSDALAGKLVAALTVRDLRRFRDAQLKKGLARDSINRVSHAFKAALTLAANHDPRINTRASWQIGLATLHDAGEARNVILADGTVLAVIRAAYDVASEFGLLVETAAVTGARVGQLAGLRVQDVEGGVAPRLMMPSSKKGRGEKKIARRPVPIPTSLAVRLKAAGTGRAADAALLVKPNGDSWRKSDHSRPFARAAFTAGLDPAEVTIYSLRHSAIVRELLANVPARVVAAGHDTSISMLERTYSKHIADHADALSRRALLDPGVLLGGNVVPLAGR
jgi:integrase